MERDDIIRMAREAGWTDYSLLHSVEVRRLEQFAALVSAHEREQCARLCDERAANYRMGFEEKYEAQACAYDIRARGEK